MIHEKKVKITNHGMMIIPASFRKKFNLKDGDEVFIMEDEEGYLKIYPIVPVEELRKNSFKTKELLKELEKSKKIELDLEEK